MMGGNGPGPTRIDAVDHQFVAVAVTFGQNEAELIWALGNK